VIQHASGTVKPDFQPFFANTIREVPSLAPIFV
jgi:hypothetical protein